MSRASSAAARGALAKRLVSLALPLLTIVFGLVLVTPTRAEAAPWNCPISGSGNSRSTTCYNGAGQYRVAIYCIEWHGASGSTVYGPWMNQITLKPSVAWCSWSQRVGSAWSQTR